MTIEAEGGPRRADLGSFFIAAALAALGLFMLWETWSIPVQVTYARVGPRVFPVLVGGALVLNALWFGRPHPTHFNIEEAIETARSVGAEQTYLTHLTHRVTHAELLQKLPPGVAPAYDGLEIDI